MAKYVFRVTVEFSDQPFEDLVSVQEIADEIQSILEYDAEQHGIRGVVVQQIDGDDTP